MQTIRISILVGVTAMLTGLQLHILSCAEAAPAEGLTPFSFFMARAYGQPVEHPVMRFIAFKPSDGAKFRESFEKKHGPRGRDLIDSLGRGSHKTAVDQKEETVIAGATNNKYSITKITKKPLEPQSSKQQRY